VTCYPGWDNSRHCDVGLLSTIGSDGKRDVYLPLYEELQRQREIFGVDLKPGRRLRLATDRRG
jgi:hypothetical protein